ncbi:MAG: ferrous iron transport protein A [Firmicutes bacterium]|nr:ferrous iron transport protein A [Bacillota bacterium]
MPILMIKQGEKAKVSKVTGNPAIRQRLGELGFTDGAEVEVIQAQGGDMIVKVRDSKLAITREMASRIMVAI